MPLKRHIVWVLSLSDRNQTAYGDTRETQGDGSFVLYIVREKQIDY
ncbi:hypothetical protein SAMN06296020_1284 [Anoxynatronum buryatiense]|uniref:Uncharacterized protein n=1 Tax=Anoxynatronum buryatiense TaxID=489973 RepID=A0AA45WZ99_9CLOT|nr:hypothetical protein SAMN06296020_1284 [Anoxynatronum buryatiense]